MFLLCPSSQRLYISPKDRLSKRHPKECVYKLPVNTLTHTLMRAHARQQCTPPCFLSAVRIRRTRSLRSASWRHVWLKFQWQKQRKEKKMFGCFVLFFCVESEHRRVQFGISPGTKTSQQVKVPSLFPIHLAA